MLLLGFHNYSMTKGKRRLRVCRREFKQIVDGSCVAAYNIWKKYLLPLKIVAKSSNNKNLVKVTASDLWERFGGFLLDNYSGG